LGKVATSVAVNDVTNRTWAGRAFSRLDEDCEKFSRT